MVIMSSAIYRGVSCLSKQGRASGFLLSTRLCSSHVYTFETLKVQNPKEWVYHVELHRPDKSNAINDTMWREIGQCFNQLGEDANCRSIVLSGAGKLFSAGIDLMSLASIGSRFAGIDDVARKAKLAKGTLESFQESFSSLEKCPKPVIIAVHGACIGGAVDLICAADIRYCTKDAWFQIKETEMGLAADVGTLQRLPKIVGNSSLVRELAFSARKFLCDEALSFGFVSKIFDDKDSLMTGSFELASLIASKSPVAVQGTKVNLNYSRDHSVSESLNFMATWNMSMLQSEDLMIAATSAMTKSKEPPTFSKL